MKREMLLHELHPSVVHAPLALLPTIQLGVGENSRCEQLTEGAQRRGAQAPR